MPDILKTKSAIVVDNIGIKGINNFFDDFNIDDRECSYISNMRFIWGGLVKRNGLSSLTISGYYSFPNGLVRILKCSSVYSTILNSFSSGNSDIFLVLDSQGFIYLPETYRTSVSGHLKIANFQLTTPAQTDGVYWAGGAGSEYLYFGDGVSNFSKWVIAVTRLNGALVGGETTITVDHTDGFPSTGTIAINGSFIAYTGKTPTTFTLSSGAPATPTGSMVAFACANDGTKPKGNVYAIYQNRLFIAYQSTINYSDTGSPENFGVATGIPAGGNATLLDGQTTITAMIPTNAFLIVSRKNGFIQFAFQYDSGLTTKLVSLLPLYQGIGEGIATNRSFVIVNGVMYYQAYNGNLYRNNYSIYSSVVNISPENLSISKIQSSNLGSSQCVRTSLDGRFVIFYQTGSKAWIYDVVLNAFFYDTYPFVISDGAVIDMGGYPSSIRNIVVSSAKTKIYDAESPADFDDGATQVAGVIHSKRYKVSLGKTKMTEFIYLEGYTDAYSDTKLNIYGYFDDKDSGQSYQKKVLWTLPLNPPQKYISEYRVLGSGFNLPNQGNASLYEKFRVWLTIPSDIGAFDGVYLSINPYASNTRNGYGISHIGFVGITEKDSVPIDNKIGYASFNLTTT